MSYTDQAISFQMAYNPSQDEIGAKPDQEVTPLNQQFASTNVSQMDAAIQARLEGVMRPENSGGQAIKYEPKAGNDPTPQYASKIYEAPNLSNAISEVGTNLQAENISAFGALCCVAEEVTQVRATDVPGMTPAVKPEAPKVDAVAQHMNNNYDVKPPEQLQPDEVKYTHLANNSLSSGPMPM